MDGHYFITEEVAERLRTTPQALLSARHRGAALPPAVKVGKRLLWPADGFDKWMRAQLETQSR